MKRHRIKLSNEDRDWLLSFSGLGSAKVQELNRAQILLATDEGKAGMKDADIATALGVSQTTVYNTRRRAHTLGVQATVKRKARKDKGVPHKVDGRVEAHIIALACSSTPNEEPAWTLSMIADRVVKLELVDTISRERVRQVLKKTRCGRT